MTEQWVTLQDSIQSLGLSEATIRRRIKAGKIKSKLENGRRLVLIELSNQMIDSVTEKTDSQIVALTEELKELKAQLKEKDALLEDNRQRQDTIILQLTRQLEQSQRLLEYHQEPWYRRWFKKDKKTTEQ